ncbi:P-loop NTPase fold protein [Bacillus sp. FJAT-50079]|uniref:KAP family P-loop NTPase fold protein n=1 Tax=Bacillus sp. FJAT-50079 TaxID=2833577 RepID=UPI001BCA20D8|nr:P-loop NTPase fold protein [Bacillus sp. FJAT-50079]MBS4207115.1 hypothetical protein [Bacillus sp. FJAT-50079]
METRRNRKAILEEFNKVEKQLEIEIAAMDAQNPENLQEDNHHYDAPQDAISYLADKKDELKKELIEIDYRDEFVKRQREIKDDLFHEGYIITDSDSSSDFLSRLPEAKDISKLILNKRTISPLTIGIFGNWGEGKSTFLKYIGENLESINNEVDDEEKYNKAHIVKFNASEYNDQDKIWYSMLSELFSVYESKNKWKAKLKYNFNLIFRVLRESIFSYNLILLVIFIFWLWFYTKDKSLIDVIMNNPISSNLIGIFSTIGIATNILIPILKRLKFLSKPISDRILNEVKYPNYKDLLGTREKVKDNLSILIKSWIKGRRDKIVVMVDELDRCSEKTIVEFFDALHLFLPNESLVFILSINKEAVCYALANNNKHFFEQEVITNDMKLKFGMDYLEKYITIPYHLKNTENYGSYIDNLLNNNVDNNKIFTEQEAEILTVMITEINKKRHITPREVKKNINLLLLSREKIKTYYSLGENVGSYIKFDEYICLFIYKYYFPKTFDIIVQIINDNNPKLKHPLEDIYFRSNRNLMSAFEMEKSEQYIKYIDKIRLEYILLANRISNNLT